MSARRIALALAVLLLCAAALNAQYTIPCSYASSSETSLTLTCTEGGVISIDFGYGLADLSTAFAGTGITFSYSFTAAGSLPPGTTLTSSGLFSGTLEAAGTYTLNLVFTISLTDPDLGSPITESDTFAYVFVVNPGTGAPTTVDPGGLSFSLTQGAAVATQMVSITNHSNQTQSFTASANVNSGASWLSVSPGAGTIPAFASSGLSVAVDPSKLQPGTYSGTVTISVAGGKSFTVSVLVTVSSSQPNIVTSASGLRFEAVTGGTATSPQTVTVLNSGAGTLNFTVKTSTISGGNWLSVSPSSGTVGATSSGAVTFSVSATGLQPGDYYGQATFTAAGAANSPQVVSVVLNVLSLANSPGAFVFPTGLIFVASSGGANPAAKTLAITNPSPNALTFLGTAFTNNASNWLTFSPPSGSVSANQPASVSVQPVIQGLAPGVYTADLVLNIVPAASSASTTLGQTLHIQVVLIVLPPGSSASLAPEEERPHATGCTPTKLIPVFTQLATGFSTTAAWPTPIEVTVVDDCGTLLTTGSVTATFSDGDPALSLASLKDGRWSATWEPGNKTSSVTVTAQAQETQPPLKGSQMIGGALSANPVAPAVNTGGVLSAASYIANQPLAPGSFAAIFGTNLSPGVNQSLQLPLSNQLGGTSVVIGGEQVPLLFTSTGQINAVVPYDLPVNSTQQLVVQMGSAISIPQPIVIAPAQPAVFTTNAAGTGAAIIQVYKPDGTPLPYGSSVTGGDVIVIYCAGLGAVNPPVPAGSAAPLAGPLSNTVNTVTATIGGVNATVEFAGLTPGYAQLYQVNVVVPSGLPSGNAILLLNVGGQQSAPVTIPMQ